MKLKQLIANGASALRASSALERSIANVRSKAEQLGTPFPSAFKMRKNRDAKIRAAERAAGIEPR